MRAGPLSAMSMLPFVAFDAITLPAANECLVRWEHRMGPLRRPINGDVCHALYHEGRPVAVAIASPLIRARVGGGLHHLTRENTVELSRLCAERPHLCRVALRLWREFVFPNLGFPVAISYQDADLHNGATYRFDGWERLAFARKGGTDRRSGRKPRNRWVWAWPGAAAHAPESRVVVQPGQEVPF